MIVHPEDIERVGWVDLNTLEKESDYLYAKNLPFSLTAYYNEDKSLALYSKNSEIIKLPNVTKREAECVIIWVIEAYRNIEAIMFNEWIIE
jgi:hypothetical protein